MKQVEFERALFKARDLALHNNDPGALALYAELVKRRPRNVHVWLEYAGVAVVLQKLDLAEIGWAKVEELNDSHVEVLLSMGFQYQHARLPERARRCFEKAAAIDPRHINSRINLALAFEKEQQFDEAREEVNECLRIDPKDEQARYLSAFLDVRSNRLADAEQQLRELIVSNPRHQYVRYAVHYKLAEILDRTQRFDEAMTHLQKAKEIVRGLVDPRGLEGQYDVTASKEEEIARYFRKDIVKKWNKELQNDGCGGVSGVAFLGGHPRSGTTLLEQVLAAHPDVAAVDEPPIFKCAIKPPFPIMGSISRAALTTTRRRYIQMLQQNSDYPAAGRILLEKNPSVTAQLPFLLRIFPELRVVIALRDPRDVILSCYFQNLPLNKVNANFLSFERLAKHYSSLMGIWLIVREWTGFSWIETRYEDTVRSLEKEGGRVTSFLGLEWHEKQRKFFEPNGNKIVYSPTYHEVKKPIYSDSVGRWRFYEKHLAHVLPGLESLCSAFGYS